MNGAEVLEYEILVQQKDGSFSEEAVYCNGAQPAIITSRECNIPLVTLRAAPYSLVFKDTVFAKVRTRNVNGWSPGFSPVNLTGATIQT